MNRNRISSSAWFIFCCFTQLSRLLDWQFCEALALQLSRSPSKYERSFFSDAASIFGVKDGLKKRHPSSIVIEIHRNDDKFVWFADVLSAINRANSQPFCLFQRRVAKSEQLLIINFVEIMEHILGDTVDLQVDDYSGCAVIVGIQTKIAPATEAVVSQNSAIGSTMEWVDEILVKKGVCPYTKSVAESGQGLRELGVVPGKVMYLHHQTNSITRLLEDYCRAASRFLSENGWSSILLVAPFFNDRFDDWLLLFDGLEAIAISVGESDKIGNVCFHPLYQTPSLWRSFGHLPSLPRLKQWWLDEEGEGMPIYSEAEMERAAWRMRQTPHATINCLYSADLAAAEKKRVSRSLYTSNIKMLMSSD